jgi:hypothetical protein
MASKTKEKMEVLARIAPVAPVAPLEAPAPRVIAPEALASVPDTTTAEPKDDISLDVAKKGWTFKQVEEYLDNQYNSDNSNKSVIFDILAMYLKHQKILYLRAQSVCEKRMNCLMMPAIAVTSLCTILGLVLKDYPYGATLVSCLNGFNAFLLAIISYLKLDAKSEAHRMSAYKFDKLQSQLEFASGRTLFTQMDYAAMIKIIDDTETSIRDIKETNKFVLPEVILRKYSRLYNMNVFAEVKKIHNGEMQATNELLGVLNELKKLGEDVGNGEGGEGEGGSGGEGRRKQLKDQEKKLVDSIIAMKDDYLEIDREEKESGNENGGLKKMNCKDAE